MPPLLYVNSRLPSGVLDVVLAATVLKVPTVDPSFERCYHRIAITTGGPISLVLGDRRRR